MKHLLRILLLLSCIVTAARAQSAYESKSARQPWRFLSDLASYDDDFRQKGLLVMRDTYRYRNSRRNHLKTSIDHLHTYPVIRKSYYSGTEYAGRDSIAISPLELHAIVRFYKRQQPKYWENDFSWNTTLISRREAEIVSRANGIISLAGGDACKPVYRCARPFFFRNDSLAVFFWQRFGGIGDTNGYGTFSLYVREQKGWRHFAPIYNWEGVYSLD